MSHASQHSAEPLTREVAHEVAGVMQALATPSRLLILDRLRRGPSSVGDLSRAVSMEQSAVSHQLRILRPLGLVVSERRGRQIFYDLHDPHVGDLLQEAIGHAEHLGLGQQREIARKAS